MDIIGDDWWKLEGMAVHPYNAMQLFVTNGIQLMHTYNGGSEWEETDYGKPVGFNRLFYNPHNASKIIGFYNVSSVARGVRLRFSHDGGDNWEYAKGHFKIEGSPAEVLNVDFHPTDENKAAICGENIYAFSDDNGITWNGVFGSNGRCVASITDVQFDMRNPDILYGAEDNYHYEGTTTVLRSTDGGYTWEKFFNESITTNGTVLSLDMKDNLLALYTYAGGIYLLDVDAVNASVAPVVNEEGTAPYYDLMGRKVAQPTRGIYIREGRKVVIE